MKVDLKRWNTGSRTDLGATGDPRRCSISPSSDSFHHRGGGGGGVLLRGVAWNDPVRHKSRDESKTIQRRSTPNQTPSSHGDNLQYTLNAATSRYCRTRCGRARRAISIKTCCDALSPQFLGCPNLFRNLAVATCQLSRKPRSLGVLALLSSGVHPPYRAVPLLRVPAFPGSTVGSA